MVSQIKIYNPEPGPRVGLGSSRGKGSLTRFCYGRSRMISVHGFHTPVGDEYDDFFIFEDDVLGPCPIQDGGESAPSEDNANSNADGACKNGKCEFRALEIIRTSIKNGVDDNNEDSDSGPCNLKREDSDSGPCGLKRERSAEFTTETSGQDSSKKART